MWRVILADAVGKGGVVVVVVVVDKEALSKLRGNRWREEEHDL